MLKKFIALFFALLPIILVQHKHTYAYDDKVHAKISIQGIRSSDLNDVLGNEFGFDRGISTVLQRDRVIQSVSNWISFGAQAEDYGINGQGDWETTRAYNHFHDPLKAWNEAGFENPVFNPIYWASYGEWPVSTILWGLAPDPQDKPRILETTGNWSWPKAREYLHLALTAPTISERDRRFAECFRSLGQVIHLMQDMSVPLHTRNDLHAFPIMIGGTPRPRRWWTYETYVSENVEHLNYSAQSPHSILLEDPRPDSHYADLLPITGLFDRNVYDGTVLPLNTSLIGLAEYSNAYFLTQDTMWTYPHPSFEDTNLEFFDWIFTESITAEDGKMDERIYLRRREEMGPSGRPFAAVDYFFGDYRDMIGQVDSPFLLDEECWKESAQKLIPKAVGYSAEVIEYFFRGRLGAYWLDEGVKVTNLSKETMYDGTFELFCEDSSDRRKRVTIFSGAEISSLSPAEETIISCDPPCEGKEDLSCFIIYRGGLGDEVDTVVAKRFGSYYCGPRSKWIRSLGGVFSEFGRSVRVTSDGGYIVAGNIYFPFAPPENVYLAKTDAKGNLRWEKTYGGWNHDWGTDVMETRDGGFIVIGNAHSFSPDGSARIYVIKTDKRGYRRWEKTYAQERNLHCFEMDSTSDGGYIIAGQVEFPSGGGDTDVDVYVMKIAADGDKLWDKKYGGTDHDTAHSVRETSDGGFIVAGSTRSFSNSSEVYLIKTDKNGNLEWEKHYSGAYTGNSVQQTSDGGYVIAGNTMSFGAGHVDVYLLKTDAAGNLQWQKAYGGEQLDEGHSVQQTEDDGFIIAGYTLSFSEDDISNAYLIKTDPDGRELWSRNFAGKGGGWAFSVQQTFDTGYIVAGYTRSLDFDSDNDLDNYDVLLIKTDEYGNIK